MKSNPITFLILASVAQCLCDQSSVATAVLSDSDSASLLKLQDYHFATVSNELIFFGNFFDQLEEHVVPRANNATSTTEDQTAENSTALTPLQLAVVYSFGGVKTALGLTTCDAATKNQDAAFTLLNSALQSITTAFTLAVTSNGAETASAIEEYRIPVISDFLELLDKIYASIAECRSETSAEVLKVIEIGQRRSNYCFTRIVNAAFDAIQDYGNAVATKSVDMELLTKIEGHQAAILISDATQVAGKFAVMQAIFMYYNQETNVSISDLYLSVLKKTGDKNAAAVADLADLADEDTDSDSAIAEWMADTYQILQTTEELSARSSEVAAHLIEHEQTSDASNAVAAMKDMTTEAGTAAVGYTVSLFNTLINEFDTSKDFKAEFLTHWTAANSEFETITNAIAKAIGYMADAASGKQMDELWCKISAEQATVASALKNVAKILSY